MDSLAKPPFGIKRGVFPYPLPALLLCCIGSRSHSMTKGYTRPSLSYEHLERMVRRPDLFSFQRFRIEGVRAALFDEYSRALFGEVRESVQLLDLARPLTQFVLGLDEHAQKTRRLSETTLHVRQAFFLSKSPEKFLFNELPLACGFDGVSDILWICGKTHRCTKGVERCTSRTNPVHAQRSLCGKLWPCRGHALERASQRTARQVPWTRPIHRRRAGPSKLHSPRLRVHSDGRRVVRQHPPVPRPQATREVDGPGPRHGRVSLWPNSRNASLELEKLRLHYEATSKQDSTHEVILVKTVSSLEGELDEVVSLNQRNSAAIADAKRKNRGGAGRYP